MSTGLECEFFEPKPNEWYYALQMGSCPVQVWDWREFADVYGPFKSEEKAAEHLSNNHANPGGYSVTPYELTKQYKIYTDLIKEVIK